MVSGEKRRLAWGGVQHGQRLRGWPSRAFKMGSVACPRAGSQGVCGHMWERSWLTGWICAVDKFESWMLGRDLGSSGSRELMLVGL